ncbi:hypothetical protein ABPG72_017750 [Tetrahymena utriculariae]
MSHKVRDQEESNRQTIYLNDRTQNQLIHRKFYNHIKTSKYTWWNFVPKALILQFMRAANFYFLISTVVQCIDIISPLAPFSAVGPLILVLAVSLSREAIEDYKRHRNDDLVNEQKSFIFNNKNFTSIMWKDIQIGDIIKVNQEQILPADILVITTNEENGTGFVETANLDGERNLKSKISHEIVNKYGREHSLIKFKGKIVCDKPNNRIHHFKGLLYLDDESKPIVLNNNNVMLRGTTLKNTEWVIGVVIYSGQDTKIMRNQGQVKHKSTHIEKKINPIIFITLLVQLGLCLIMAILLSNFQKSTNPLENSKWNYAYLYGNSSDGVYSYEVQGTINFFTYFLLLNSLIPISLIISMEVVKLFQSSFMEYDVEMHYLEDGEVQKMKVLNTMIHEELGKIDYIFTDKTGTLTCNIMIFRHANIAGSDYSEKELEDILAKLEYQTLTYDEEYKEFYKFWMCIAICHDVILEEKENEINYQGSSPDEVCLVEKAQKYNFKFLKKTTNQIFIQVGSEMHTFKLLNKIEFTSERKRMSVIIQDPITGKIVMYTKGADSFLLKNISNTSEALKSNIKDSLKHYSKHGLRTLCLGMREVSQQEYDAWNSQIQELNINMVGDLFPEKTKEKIADLENEIETGFDLLGVTALEDKLQDGVPEVLKDFHEAGINVWMLTGDKLETAENIGYLCNLLNNQTKVFRVQSHYPDVTRDKFFRIKGRINQIKTVSEIGEIRIKNKKAGHQNQNVNKIINDGGSQSRRDSYLTKEENNSFEINQVKGYTGFALLIEGEAIGHALHDDQCRKEFLQIIPECCTVICCRSTPTQKAEMVKFVKTHFNKTCLAIGDGGNDVTMIQEADIGVGIIGKEGNQAALSSDYYFGQFRFLWRLLFVHGRWNLYRTSYFVNYFFLKNFVFTLQQFYFGFFCAYSGQSFWEDGYLLNFNSIITACAPVYFAAFEQDVNPHGSQYIAKYLPRLYKIFREKDLFSFKVFGIIFFQGTVLSLTTYFSVFFINYEDYFQISGDGKIDGLWYQSFSSYCSTVGVVWAINFMDTTYFSPFTFFSYVIVSLFLFFPAFAFTYDIFTGPLQEMLLINIGNWKFWLTLFLNVAFICIIKHAYKVYKYLFAPELVHDLQYHRKKLNEAEKQAKNQQSDPNINNSNTKNNNNNNNAYTTPENGLKIELADNHQQKEIVIQNPSKKSVELEQKQEKAQKRKSSLQHMENQQNLNVEFTELKLQPNHDLDIGSGRKLNKPQSQNFITIQNNDQSVLHSEQSNMVNFNNKQVIYKNINHNNESTRSLIKNHNNNNTLTGNNTHQNNNIISNMHTANQLSNNNLINTHSANIFVKNQSESSQSYSNKAQDNDHPLAMFQKNKQFYIIKNEISDHPQIHADNQLNFVENNEEEEERAFSQRSQGGSDSQKKGSQSSDQNNQIKQSSVNALVQENEDFNDDEMNEYSNSINKINKLPKEQNKKISVYEKDSQLQSKIHTNKGVYGEEPDRPSNLDDSKKIYIANDQFESAAETVPKTNVLINNENETSQQLKELNTFNINYQNTKINIIQSEKNSELPPATRYEGVKIPQVDSDNEIEYQTENLDLQKIDEMQKYMSKSKFSQLPQQQDDKHED